MLDASLRGAAAEAVHRAVAATAGPECRRGCALYALAGARLLAELDHETRYLFQAGSFALLIDPPDGWFEMRVDEDDFDGREFHCWIGALGASAGLRDGTPAYCPAALIDFAARHLKDRYENASRARAWARGILVSPPVTPEFPWQVPDPPAYYWFEGEPPAGIRYVPSRVATLAILRHGRERAGHWDDPRDLARAARDHFDRIVGERGLSRRGGPPES